MNQGKLRWVCNAYLLRVVVAEVTFTYKSYVLAFIFSDLSLMKKDSTPSHTHIAA